MNLLATHTHTPAGTSLRICTCARAACGAAEAVPGTRPTHCTAHGSIAVQHHRAINCPALPVDADLSKLWLIAPTWTASGPIAGDPQPFTRAALDDLRRVHALWDLALGDTADQAVNAWRMQVSG
ncbi:MAG TPA: hypothetical protein VN520_34855 [Streptomyces sp.]|uniref:hypothetical protein n=1 Tax=Streptomyces sp. TaxID=1931 RepID=UPI002C908218|nr:hypothetical protein [Streptomyces sp.]HWU11480.1 hypothetical protein [Streptomyces sp.]